LDILYAGWDPKKWGDSTPHLINMIVGCGLVEALAIPELNTGVTHHGGAVSYRRACGGSDDCKRGNVRALERGI